MPEERFAIAHVTPYPWEAQENEVNAHVKHVAQALSRRGHRVLVLAPSRSQERVRASRKELRAARGRPQSRHRLWNRTWNLGARFQRSIEDFLAKLLSSSLAEWHAQLREQ